MSASLGKAPGFERHPQHRIEIQPADRRWQASQGEQVLADSRDALLVEESNHALVVYFPQNDVHLDELRGTETKTTCPFKGEASYFQLASDDLNNDVAWTYPATFDEVSSITGYIAFYTNQVSVNEINHET